MVHQVYQVSFILLLRLVVLLDMENALSVPTHDYLARFTSRFCRHFRELFNIDSEPADVAWGGFALGDHRIEKGLGAVHETIDFLRGCIRGLEE